ncbi:MAG: POTRA domain-containing protein [Planctomycetota bacterium]|nr:POTRA domain-containing protein [Planctomycetota bacterium]
MRCDSSTPPPADSRRPVRPVGTSRPPRNQASILLRHLRTLIALLVVSIGSPGLVAGPFQDSIEDETYADRPISEVEIRGLDRVDERLVRNNLRTASGQPFVSSAVREDVATLYRLGQFETVTAEAVLEADGSVKVVFRVVEQALIREVQTVGNSVVSDQELRSEIPLYSGGPRDDFLVEQALIRIKELYRTKGHYLAEVRVDESRLEDAGILIFVIVEGPRVRIREIEFVGNRSFPANELGSQIETKPAIVFFRKGELDPNRLIDDVATLDAFYKDRGWVDVRVDHRVMLSPDSKEAKVVFVIEEGRQYRLRQIEITSLGGPDSPLEVFTSEQLLSLAVIRPGAPYLKPSVDKTVEAVRNAYRRMGFVDVQVTARGIRVGEEPELDLLVAINEGRRSTTGLVSIQGNFLTKDKVIRRLIRVRPARPLDATELELAERRIQATRLFNDVRVAIQQPDVDEPEVRDIIVEIKERNTGSFNFGAGLGSDTGIFGEFSFRQQNFDIADLPLSVEELVSGRAFRGGGQSFDITLAPGNEVSLYSVSLSEPHLFESDVSGQVSGFYRTRIYQQYDEERLAVNGTIGQRLGDVWVGNATLGVQRVKLSNFDASTTIEVYEDRGPDLYADLGGSLRRTTLDDTFRPSKGSVVSLGFGKTIPIIGDVDFWQIDAELTSFVKIYEDFLGRKQILKLRSEVGWIFGGEAPTFDRYYLGGRSFRGFAFRTVSPKSTTSISGATISPEPIGGDWLFFAGAQYEVPIVGNSISGVAFVDSGTVTTTPGFDDYRVSVGLGIRLYLDALGPAPLAFDFGFPLVEQEGDQRQTFSFSAELPF